VVEGLAVVNWPGKAKKRDLRSTGMRTHVLGPVPVGQHCPLSHLQPVCGRGLWCPGGGWSVGAELAVVSEAEFAVVSVGPEVVPLLSCLSFRIAK